MAQNTSRLLAVTAVLLFLVSPLPVFAQQGGVLAGITFASLSPEEADEAPLLSHRTGFTGGAWFRTAPRGRASFQIEGLFVEKGVEFDVTPLGLDSSADVRFRYVEVPLLARGDFGASSSRFFIVGGVAPAFMLSARGTTSFQGQEHTTDLDDQVESFDLGLVGGGGVSFGRASVEARYTHGLLRTNTDNNDPNDKIKNRVFAVMFGYRLR